jgi:hypothetical protein
VFELEPPQVTQPQPEPPRWQHAVQSISGAIDQRLLLGKPVAVSYSRDRKPPSQAHGHQLPRSSRLWRPRQKRRAPERSGLSCVYTV